MQHSISIGDNVRHKTKLLNGNVPMKVSAITEHQVQCEHFEPSEDSGTIHLQSWFSVDEVEKVVYGGQENGT